MSAPEKKKADASLAEAEELETAFWEEDDHDLETVVIRFAGDSGDGMQLTGNQFANTSAHLGNDLATLPDYPAEIRAPAGTLAGVSGFQLQLGRAEIYTAGDSPDVLVALNPAALKASLPELARGTIIILNEDTCDPRSLERAGFDNDPCEDGTLESYRVIKVPITSVTHRALESTSLSFKERERCKNFFALGLMYWMYGRPLSYTLEWIDEKFKNKGAYLEANKLALKAGYHYGETTELFAHTYTVGPATLDEGVYRNLTGNHVTSLGLITASKLTGLDLFLGSYPITPATEILHELSRYKNFGVRTFQAEDEIAAIGATIGAAFGGSLAVTTTSGPGVALKSEALGLAVMTELPVIVANIQRGGPSTGLPTKTEQADLLQAMFGRNGECPAVIVAPATPSDCFSMVLEAARLATKYMTPVFFLSDGYVANGSEPFLVPEIEDLPDLKVQFRTEEEGFAPYVRDPATLARPWVRPGTPGLEHRIGGLEKQDVVGHVSYDPLNHEAMVRMRARKIDNIAGDIPDAEIFGEPSGDVLVIGWGGTHGAIRAAVKRIRSRGFKVSHLHLRHINPMPTNVESTLRGFKRVLVAELNQGQLRWLLRAKYLIDAEGIHKVQGKPFQVREIAVQIWQRLGGLTHAN